MHAQQPARQRPAHDAAPPAHARVHPAPRDAEDRTARARRGAGGGAHPPARGVPRARARGEAPADADEGDRLARREGVRRPRGRRRRACGARQQAEGDGRSGCGFWPG